MRNSTTVRRGPLVGIALAIALVLAACVAPIPVVPVDENPPTISPLADRTVLRNTLTPRSITVTVDITDPDDDSFTATVEADDDAVLASQSVACTPALCALTLTPSADATATVTVTVTVTSDSGGEGVATFVLRVAPTLVTTTGDDGSGSLRRTLVDAEAGDVLSFDSVGAFATPQVIALEQQIVLDRDVTIEGLGNDPYGVTISASGAPAPTRLFAISGGATVVMHDLQLEDGLLAAGGAEEDGGAILVGADAELTLIGSRLRVNRAVRGGAIFNDGGTVLLDDSAILGSVGGPIAPNADEGGGIFNAGGALTLRNGSRVSDSVATVSGGGIVSTGALAIVDSEVSDNSATVDGGGLWSDSEVTVTGGAISGNVASGDGGGIYLQEGTLELIGVELSDNEASSGGGLFNWRGVATVEGSTIGDPDLTDGAPRGNRSGGGAGLHSEGDPALAPDGASLTLRSSLVVGNVISDGGEGGGIYSADGRLHLIDSRVSANSASDCGGIWSDSGDVALIEDSIIGDPDLGDGLDEGNVGEFYGGGLCRGGGEGTVTLVNTRVAGNHTDGDGGGLYLEGGTLHVTEGSLVVGNDAERGGGIFVDPDDNPTELVVDASTVGGSDPLDANTAVEGGGIFHAEDALEVRNGSRIVGNTAELGGGIHQLGNGTTTTIRDSTIGGDAAAEGNRATLFGGGLYLDGGGGPLRGGMTLIDSAVIGNDGDSNADDLGFGGGIYSDGAVLTLEGTEVASNSAHQGGGIYNASESFLDLDAQTSVVGNTATQGVVGASGGGIYNLGTIVANDADVSGNTPDDFVEP